MTKQSIATPFFILNPKSYLFGEELLALAKTADQLAADYPVSVFVTCPFADIRLIAEHTSNIIVTAQHMDGIIPGRGMGHVLPDSLKAAGANATFLNHAEQPLSLSRLEAAMTRANELSMITIVCADTLAEARAVAMLKPDIILCEPTELIGTGKTSDANYIEKTNEAIKSVDDTILVMQAAGISSAEDVYRTIMLQADGTGCTSGIVCAEDPKQMLIDMVKAATKAYQERGNE